MSFGDKKASVPDRQIGSGLTSEPLEGGPAVLHDTVQCCHCQYTSTWVVGSDKWWGSCSRCGGLTCGRTCCRSRGCVYKERELDLMEKGIAWGDIHEGMNPIMASVPGIIPGK